MLVFPYERPCIPPIFQVVHRAGWENVPEELNKCRQFCLQQVKVAKGVTYQAGHAGRGTFPFSGLAGLEPATARLPEGEHQVT